jgi:hypothetical protein
MTESNVAYLNKSNKSYSKIIRDREYNTQKAHVVYATEFVLDDENDEFYMYCALYKKQNGEYFLFEIKNQTNHWRVFKDECEVKIFCEDWLSPKEYIRIFGILE